MSWQPPEPLTTFNYVGVDIFAGGFTVGISKYFNVLAHLEEGTFGVDTFKANFPRVPVHVGIESWPDFSGVDFLAGNPPCSPWSSIGRSMHRGRESWRTDPNAAFGRRYVEYGLRMRPKVWAFESVPPLERSEFLRDVARMWLEAGYAFTLVRQDAKFWGLPQQRRRLFMVAHKVTVDWRPHVEVVTANRMATAGEALETVLDPGYMDKLWYGHDELLKDLAPGQGLRTLWEERNPWYREVEVAGKPVPGRPILMAHRVRPDAPSLTVVGQNAYVHPFEDRMLGHLELARLCGYPDGYEWRESAGYLHGQVAKSVTPPAGEFLAYNIAAALTGGVSAEPEARRVTMWAPSPRVLDYRFQATTEPLPIKEAPVTIITPDPDPPAATGRVLITGVTPLQVNSPARRSDYVSLPYSLQRAFQHVGWTADWGHPRLGWEALDRGGAYDCVFIGVCGFESMSANQVYDAMYLYERQRAAGGRVVLYHDDWQVHTFFSTAARWASGHRKIHAPTLEDREKHRRRSPDEHRPLQRVLESWVDPAMWPPVVVPLMDLGDGDTTLVDNDRWPVDRLVRWNQVPFYPTFEELAVDPATKLEAWTYTTLFKRHDPWRASLDLTWPVTHIGGSAGLVSEVESANAIARNVAALSPPHAIVDDGWARSRHWFGVHLGTAVLGDPRELGQWLSAYAYTPREFELMTPTQRADLIDLQREQYLAATPTRDEMAARAVALVLGTNVLPTPVGTPAASPTCSVASTASDPAPAASGAAAPRAARPPKPTQVPTVARPVGPGVATEYRDLEVTDLDRVLDIGAHRGEFLRYVRGRAPHAEVFCFEPDPDNFRELQHIPDDYAVNTVFGEFAVTAEALEAHAEVDLYRCNGSDTSMHSLLPKRGRTPIRVGSIGLTHAYETAQPTVVKLAVEGYEKRLVFACDFPDSVARVAVKFHPSTDASREEARATVRLIEAQGFTCVRRPQLDRGSWPVVGVWRR